MIKALLTPSLFWVFGLIVLSKVVLSYSPFLGDSWFEISSVIIEESTLPANIEITKAGTGDYFSKIPALVNHSSEPFYLLEKEYSYLLGKDYPNSEISNLPKGYRPDKKIVSGKTYVYKDYLSSDQPVGWHDPWPQSNIKNHALVDDFSSNNSISRVLLYLGDSRPEDITVPESQSFIVLGYYKNDVWEIEGAVSFQLNSDYDSRAMEKYLARRKLERKISEVVRLPLVVMTLPFLFNLCYILISLGRKQKIRKVWFILPILYLLMFGGVSYPRLFN